MPSDSKPKLDENVKTSSLPENVAFALFCATSIQFALFRTFVPVIMGVKTDLYSGAICAVTLSCAILATSARAANVAWAELVISGALITLAILSGVFSATPWSSTVWSLTWGANALGGYWAARLLLTNQLRVRIFVWLCAGTLDLLLTLSLWGYYFHGLSSYFLSDLHFLVNIILLLSFASLALITSQKPLGIIFGIFLLLLSYAGLYVCAVGGIESALLIPAIILVPGLILSLSRSKSRLAAVLVVLFAVAVTAHYLSFVTTEQYSDKGYQWGRFESYTFSAHVAKQSPWVGIGLRTPRTPYLADYVGWHPKYSEKEFSSFISWAVSSQNVFLTFMVGFGVPFASIYALGILLLLIRLLRATISPDPDSFVPPLALLIPITGSILHFMMMDNLLMPTVAWFFHILLALIPKPLPKTQRKGVRFRSVLSFAGIAIIAAMLGIIVGTHPAFRPENFPSFNEIKDKFRKLPLISTLIEAKASREVSDKPDWAALTVNVQGYHGKPSSWAVECVLDNSPSMARLDGAWNPNRIASALALIEKLGTETGAVNKLAVRDFVNVGPLKRRGGRELVLRLSRMKLPWTVLPLQSDYIGLLVSSETGENNLCAAIESALKRDFVAIDTQFRSRILLITDAATECSLDPLLETFKRSRPDHRQPLLDVALLGATGPWAERLSVGVLQSGGVSLSVNFPDDLTMKLRHYLKTLKSPIMDPIVLTRKDHIRNVLPGSTVELESGNYDITLPEIEGVDKANRKIEGIKVSGGENKVVNIVVHQGQVTVE